MQLEKTNNQLVVSEEINKIRNAAVRKLNTKEYVKNCFAVSRYEDVRSRTDLTIGECLEIGDLKQTSGLILLTTQTIMHDIGGPKFNLPQLEFITQTIISDCGSFTYSDLVLMIKMGMSGQLGKIFGEIRIDNILGKGGWIDEYLKFRAIKEEIIHKEESKKRKAIEDEFRIPIECEASKNERVEKMAISRDIRERKAAIIKIKKDKIRVGEYTYNSVKEYIELNNIDPDEYLKPKKNKWLNDFKMLSLTDKSTSWDDYYLKRGKELLIEINKRQSNLKKSISDSNIKMINVLTDLGLISNNHS